VSACPVSRTEHCWVDLLLADHLERFADPKPHGFIFIGPKGGRLRRPNFREIWYGARGQTSRPLGPGARDLATPSVRRTHECASQMAAVMCAAAMTTSASAGRRAHQLNLRVGARSCDILKAEVAPFDGWGTVKTGQAQ
jgi:hypothetical protein